MALQGTDAQKLEELCKKTYKGKHKLNLNDSLFRIITNYVNRTSSLVFKCLLGRKWC